MLRSGRSPIANCFRDALQEGGNSHEIQEIFEHSGLGSDYCCGSGIERRCESEHVQDIIHEFEVPKNPTGNLTIDGAGNLYGTTMFGGRSAGCASSETTGCGVVWKLAPNGKLTMLYQFTGGADGALPEAGVILDAAGNLYGTTYSGGAYNYGVVFKLAPNADGTWTESVLHSFTGAPDGNAPSAGLIFDATGNLYGTTWAGGASDAGVVFKLAPNPDGTWTESVLQSFSGGADGSGPWTGLIFDATGNLYGTTFAGGSSCDRERYGCGVVFKLAPNPDGTWTESVLHSFGYRHGEGGFPSGLVFDTAGNLYGTTIFWPSGFVFKLQPNADGTWSESILHVFGGTDGFSPNGPLIFDAAGNLYGTTYYGGHGGGVVFKLIPTSSGWSETVLNRFRGRASLPDAPVIFDQKGNLYGTTTSGTGNYRVVFDVVLQ